MGCKIFLSTTSSHPKGLWCTHVSCPDTLRGMTCITSCCKIDVLCSSSMWLRLEVDRLRKAFSLDLHWYEAPPLSSILGIGSATQAKWAKVAGKFPSCCNVLPRVQTHEMTFVPGDAAVMAFHGMCCMLLNQRPQSAAAPVASPDGNGKSVCFNIETEHRNSRFSGVLLLLRALVCAD